MSAAVPVTELARELGLDRSTLLKACQRGDVVAHRFGRYWAVDATSARRYFRTARTRRIRKVRAA